MDKATPGARLRRQTMRSTGAGHTGVAILCSLMCHGVAATLFFMLSLTRVQQESNSPVAVAMVFEEDQPESSIPEAAPPAEPAAVASSSAPPVPAEPPSAQAAMPNDAAPATPSAPALPVEEDPAPPAAATSQPAPPLAAAPEASLPAPGIPELPLPSDHAVSVPPPVTTPAVPRARPAARPHPAPLRPTPPPVRPLQSRPVPQNSAEVPSPTQASPPPQRAGLPSQPTLPTPAFPAVVGAGWRNALAAWLQSHRSYPDAARQRSEEGTAVIRFTVARDGQVLAVTLVRSSGSATLDEAAQAMLRGVRLPFFTADMSQDQTTVTVPVRYRLNQ